jgi:hypothetical protein
MPLSLLMCLLLLLLSSIFEQRTPQGHSFVFDIHHPFPSPLFVCFLNYETVVAPTHVVVLNVEQALLLIRNEGGKLTMRAISIPELCSGKREFNT